MENKIYLDLGKSFYDWHHSGKLKFFFEEDNKNLEMEIERVSELVEYVKEKREDLTT
ncbi:MAG: hypothetical protein HQL24_02635 [Candidatus Omnitrophica bacterium]|nr:hypothetical protein [Candidatus Omnitrophota bacterium]